MIGNLTVAECSLHPVRPSHVGKGGGGGAMGGAFAIRVYTMPTCKPGACEKVASVSVLGEACSRVLRLPTPFTTD